MISCILRKKPKWTFFILFVRHFWSTLVWLNGLNDWKFRPECFLPTAAALFSGFVQKYVPKFLSPHTHRPKFTCGIPRLKWTYLKKFSCENCRWDSYCSSTVMLTYIVVIFSIVHFFPHFCHYFDISEGKYRAIIRPSFLLFQDH